MVSGLSKKEDDKHFIDYLYRDGDPVTITVEFNTKEMIGAIPSGEDIDDFEEFMQ